MKQVAGTAISALGVPLRAEQHAYRADQMMMEDYNVGKGMTGQQNQQSMLTQNRLQGLMASNPMVASPLGLWNAISNPGATAHMLSPSGWARDWRETTNGEKTFDPVVENSIKQSTKDPNVFNMAKAMASGRYHPGDR